MAPDSRLLELYKNWDGTTSWFALHKEIISGDDQLVRENLILNVYDAMKPVVKKYWFWLKNTNTSVILEVVSLSIKIHIFESNFAKYFWRCILHPAPPLKNLI